MEGCEIMDLIKDFENICSYLRNTKDRSKDEELEFEMELKKYYEKVFDLYKKHLIFMP